MKAMRRSAGGTESATMVVKDGLWMPNTMLIAT